MIDDLAGARRLAIRLATRLRRNTQDTADDAVALEAAIGRAVAALKRQRPTTRGGHR